VDVGHGLHQVGMELLPEGPERPPCFQGVGDQDARDDLGDDRIVFPGRVVHADEAAGAEHIENVLVLDFAFYPRVLPD
jgi:hypothetical protein